MKQRKRAGSCSPRQQRPRGVFMALILCEDSEDRRSWKKSAALIWIKCCWWVSIFQVAQWTYKRRREKERKKSASRTVVLLSAFPAPPQLSDKRPTSHQLTFTTAIISRVSHGLLIIPYTSMYIVYIYLLQSIKTSALFCCSSCFCSFFLTTAERAENSSSNATRHNP